MKTLHHRQINVIQPRSGRVLHGSWLDDAVAGRLAAPPPAALKGFALSCCFIFEICLEISSEYSCVLSLLILHRSFMASTLLTICRGGIRGRSGKMGEIGYTSVHKARARMCAGGLGREWERAAGSLTSVLAWCMRPSMAGLKLTWAEVVASPCMPSIVFLILSTSLLRCASWLIISLAFSSSISRSISSSTCGKNEGSRPCQFSHPRIGREGREIGNGVGGMGNVAHLSTI